MGLVTRCRDDAMESCWSRQQIASNVGSTVSASTNSPVSFRPWNVVLIPGRFRKSRFAFTPLDLPIYGGADQVEPIFAFFEQRIHLCLRPFGQSEIDVFGPEFLSPHA